MVGNRTIQNKAVSLDLVPFYTDSQLTKFLVAQAVEILSSKFCLALVRPAFFLRSNFQIKLEGAARSWNVSCAMNKTCLFIPFHCYQSLPYIKAIQENMLKSTCGLIYFIVSSWYFILRLDETESKVFRLRFLLQNHRSVLTSA